MSIFDPNNIEKALEFLPKEKRTEVIDAVYCEIHNSWGQLEGNTAETDVMWFARWLCNGFHHSGYDRLSEDEQRFWNNLAEQCIRGLPMLMSRMETRYETYKDALHVLLQSEWAAKRAEDNNRETT